MTDAGPFTDDKNLVSKSCSALCTTSLEYFSAVSGLHSLSEAVLLLSLALFGLICSKHIRTSLRFMEKILFTDSSGHSPIRIGTDYYT